VVGDHLVHERRRVRRRVERRPHVVVHGAVHGVEAVAEGPARERPHAAAEEVLAGALLGAAHLVFVEAVRAARQVVRRRRLVVVRRDQGVVRAGRGDHGAGRIGDLDVAAHARVDVAEVEDVRRVRRVRERQLDRVRRRGPIALAVEELGLVRVEAEVLAARRRRERIVVARGAGENAILVVHRRLARVGARAGVARLRNTGLELVDLVVRAVDEVSKA